MRSAIVWTILLVGQSLGASHNPGIEVRLQSAPTVEGCTVFPSDNIWNVPVDTLPRDAHSDEYVAVIGAGKALHPDFGSGVWPARHYASSLTGAQYPPLGQRFQLRRTFDISGFHPQVQVILRALQKYGMILADNGSSWYISGAPDERWDNGILAELKTLQGADFEAVSVTSLRVGADSGAAAASASTTLLFPHIGNLADGKVEFRTEIILVNQAESAFVRVEFPAEVPTLTVFPVIPGIPEAQGT